MTGDITRRHPICELCRIWSGRWNLPGTPGSRKGNRCTLGSSTYRRMGQMGKLCHHFPGMRKICFIQSQLCMRTALPLIVLFSIWLSFLDPETRNGTHWTLSIPITTVRLTFLRSVPRPELSLKWSSNGCLSFDVQLSNPFCDSHICYMGAPQSATYCNAAASLVWLCLGSSYIVGHCCLFLWWKQWKGRLHAW
jgi:hypothetical protein